MRILYISGPYWAKTLRGVINNIRRAEAVAIELWGMGYVVICPHLNTQFFPGGTEEREADKEIDYVEGDLEILKRLTPRYDGIVMLPAWDYSKGAQRELKGAQQVELFVYFWPEDKDLLKREVNFARL